MQQVLKIPASYGVKVGIINKQENSEPSYTLGFDEPSDQDTVFHLPHFKLVIPKTKTMHLVGLHVDYIPEEKGFVFLHPA